MALNLDERNQDFFLLKNNHTPSKIGPGAYFEDKIPSPYN